MLFVWDDVKFSRFQGYCSLVFSIQFQSLTENFKKVLSMTTTHKASPFDFHSSFVKQYFGQKKSASLDYFEFSQLLQVRTVFPIYVQQ